MQAKAISQIHDFSLEARDLLEREVSGQLEGIYGLLPDGKWAPHEKYPAIQKLPEARETRERLTQFLDDERAAGLKPKEAREKIVKETAFTWLNRLVAFKMMESRKLFRQTVSKGPQSNGFLMWLTEPGNEAEYALHEQGDLPLNDMGEGPRHKAYRHFILHQCTELAKEIRVLFDPSNLPTRLFPRPRALAAIIDKMNAAELSEAWAPGNEETIGWIYQSFNSQELEKAFREVRLSGKKFEARDIPAVTQLFTLRWIVRFLVENTLGRLWIEMHPASRLRVQLEYLIPLGHTPDVPFRPASEITLLDPACGIMHFGLVAFDVFSRMYQEEIEKQGQPGWPKTPSVERAEDIPAAILQNNIHGIDIDLRAVQLSALTLFLKAKMFNPKARITETKLASADIQYLDGERMKAFLDEYRLNNPTLRRILSALQTKFKEAQQLGSLLRFEDELQSVIQKEREHFEKNGRQIDLFGWRKDQFDSDEGKEEFWHILSAQVEQTLHLFAKTQAEDGGNQSFFVDETSKGLRLLELLTKSYDVVVTNPPYMSSRKMNNVLKVLVARDYPEGKGDLYASFIRRCIELVSDCGRVGMLTMHSFMFISSYENLRSWVRARSVVETLAHCGPGLFAVGNPGTLQTVAHVTRKEPDAQKREDAIGTYFRLVKEPDSESKRSRFEEAMSRLKSGESDPLAFRYRQGDFDAIPGSPWVYWITAAIRAIFDLCTPFGENAQAIHGTATYDNFRFLRYWWEVGIGGVGCQYESWRDFQSGNKNYVPYMKGGSFRRWYGNQEYVIQLLNRGRALIAFLNVKRDTIRGQDHIFKRGVTWSDLTSGRFSARLSPGGFIFDVKGSSAFPTDVNLVLALLNSSFAHYALNLLNPTVSFQVGDLSRLPIPRVSNDTSETFADEAIALAKADSAEDETTYDFIAPPGYESGIEDISNRKREMARIERAIDDEVYRLYGISDEDRGAIEAELAEGMQSETDGDSDIDQGSEKSHLIPLYERGKDGVSPMLVGKDGLSRMLAGKKGGSSGLNENEEFSPLIKGSQRGFVEEAGETVSLTLSREILARQWISYALGMVMGRFEPGVENGLGRGNFSGKVAARLRGMADADGMLVMDEGHRDDLPARVMDALDVMLGEESAADVVKAAAGKEGESKDLLRQYLERQFFKLHIQQYRKRPVYWFFQSPRKKYGIWIFHERLSKDFLYRMRKEYVEPKINLIDSRIRELQGKRDEAEGRKRREIEKDIGKLIEILDDVREFLKRLNFIIEERGYVPHIDDGVLLNMAPLWELIPSWQAEPKKAWEALERGDYDWAYQAMDHWPDRVKEKCKTNKSFAIAHGLV
jgi:hypothetical protein